MWIALQLFTMSMLTLASKYDVNCQADVKELRDPHLPDPNKDVLQ